jgi:V8-like Glu-specific endopeptidase
VLCGRRKIALSSFVTAATLLTAASLGAAGTSSAAVVAETATHFTGTPAVGALFAAGASTHHCTAGVVDSPNGDLLVTAAHCVTGTGAGQVFVPGYDDGLAPFGTWRVVAAWAAPGWLTDQDPADDVAFLEVAPEAIDGQLTEIQQVTGGYVLAAEPAASSVVTVPAYVAGDDDRPIICVQAVRVHAGYPAFDCGGYADGTSGAPWLEETAQGTEIAGVIGGLYQGGCRTDVSYSPPFAAVTDQVYERAATGAPPSTLPTLGADGCSTGL